METEVLEVKILEIQEDSFSINSEILSSLDQTDNPGIEFFISFKLNKKKSILISEASLTYLIDKEEISEKLACVSYSFVLYIKDLNNYIEDDKVRLPDRFMEELIYDVYSTGRVIAKDRLIGTRLKSVYLPSVEPLRYMSCSRNLQKWKYKINLVSFSYENKRRHSSR